MKSADTGTKFFIFSRSAKASGDGRSGRVNRQTRVYSSGGDRDNSLLGVGLFNQARQGNIGQFTFINPTGEKRMVMRKPCAIGLGGPCLGRGSIRLRQGAAVQKGQ